MTPPSEYHMNLAALIARAMRDSELRTQLQGDPVGTMRANGVEPKSDCAYALSEDSAGHINVVVPCEPLDADHCVATVGAESTPSQMYHWIITQIQTDGASKSALLDNAADALRQAGCAVPESMTVTILQDTESTAHLNIPWSPTAETDVALEDDQVAAMAGGKTATAVEQTVVEATSVYTTAEEALTVASTETAVAETSVAAVVEVVVAPILIT